MSAVWLRRVDRRKALAILARERPADEPWAEGYPTNGDLESATMLLRTLRTRPDVGAFGVYEIVERATGLTIGGIGFHRPPGPDGVVEVGYGLVPSAWNRGYATDALGQILVIARDHQARRLEGRALIDNVASRRVMEKAGLSFVVEVEGYARYEIELHENETR